MKSTYCTKQKASHTPTPKCQECQRQDKYLATAISISKSPLITKGMQF